MQTSRTAADETIARFLLPRLIEFVINKETDDPEQARALVTQSLCQYVGTVQKDRVPAVMTIVVPTLLARASAQGDDASKEISSRLLEVAAIEQDTFKAVVSGMSGGQRSFLEEVIRSGQQASKALAQSSAEGESSQPSIALKFNFGS